jgi:putative transposase
MVTSLLAGRKEFSREGPLSAWVVMWLMIFQRLDPLGTLSVGVRELLCGPVRKFVCWRRGVPSRDLSASTSAYSQARSRLPQEVVEKVSDIIFESLLARPTILPGLNRALFLLDGSTVLLSHSEDLARAYPPARNQHGASHWSVMRVLVAHEVVSGLAVRPCWGPMDGPQAVSEQGLAKQMLSRLPAGSAVMGDRNFGIFSMAYHAHQQQHPCLFRLTEVRAGKLDGGISPNAGTDKRIQWECTREDRRRNPELSQQASVQGRLIAVRVFAADGQPQKLYFFTTLDLPVDQILEFYGYRWNIETDLRSLKREVRLHTLTAKSQDMADKELVLGVAAYNLTRAAINEAAAALHLTPRQFSFSMARDTVRAFLPLFADAANEAERQQIGKQMLRVMSQSLLPRRRKRRVSTPREIWPRPCSFPKRKVSTKGKAAKEAKVAKKNVA